MRLTELVQVLLEAKLEINQIKKLFADIEAILSGTTDNRTRLGKGKDAAVKFGKSLMKEGSWGDIKNKVSTFGKNLTTKITADKLLSAWEEAGSPPYSDSIATILKNAGVPVDVINKAYKQSKIPVKKFDAKPKAMPSSDTTTAKTKRPSKKTPDIGSNVFGQMASTLAPSKSSTGGTVQKTPTGIKHTANPNFE